MFDVDEFKRNAPITQYIEQYYPKRLDIKKRTKDCVFCNCIFHDEKTPSLAFFNSTNRYKCFGCGASGDIIDLVRYLENIDFEEACTMIGNNTNQTIQFTPPNPHHEKFKDEMTSHALRYVNNLNNNPNALNYLINVRKLSPETISNFRLGLTDIDEYKYRTDIGNISDKIVFPIIEHNIKPKCLGFAYRSYKDDNHPKYINDKNQNGLQGQDPNVSGVFIKGNLLYGYYSARKPAKEKGYVILVEGYFDVLSLYDSGIKNVVGSMGTSVTDVQLDEIKKLSNNVLLMLDMDSAGRKRILDLIPVMLAKGFNVAIANYEYYKDPDELAKAFKNDTSAFEKYIECHTIQYVDYIIDEITKDYNRIVSLERMKVVNKASAFSDYIVNEEQKNYFNHLLFSKIGV